MWVFFAIILLCCLFGWELTRIFLFGLIAYFVALFAFAATTWFFIISPLIDYVASIIS